MEKLTFVWKNFGQMRLGYDISRLKIELKRNVENPSLSKIVLEIDTGKLKINDSLYGEINQIDVYKIFEVLDKIKYPQIKTYNGKGCDGDAWELYVDEEKYEGYLNRPDFLQEVLDIIHFKQILTYAKNCVRNYIKQ